MSRNPDGTRTRETHQRNILQRAGHHFGLQRNWHRSEDWAVQRGGRDWNRFLEVEGETIVRRAQQLLGEERKREQER